MRGKFREFQELLVLLAKDETKRSLSVLVSEFKTKTSDLLHKNIDIQLMGGASGQTSQISQSKSRTDLGKSSTSFLKIEPTT